MIANMLYLFGGLGPTELIIILFIILLLFGARKIPDLARGLGRGVREFKDASSQIKREMETEASGSSNANASSRKEDSRVNASAAEDKNVKS